MSDETSSLPPEQQILQAALSSPIPRLYINGFQLAQSQSDVLVISQINGAPCAVFNLSFTTAKSLAVELTKLVQNLEASTDHLIMTMEDVQVRQNQSGVRAQK